MEGQQVTWPNLLKLLHQLNGLFSKTSWVIRHQGRTILNFTEV